MRNRRYEDNSKIESMSRSRAFDFETKKSCSCFHQLCETLWRFIPKCMVSLLSSVSICGPSQWQTRSNNRKNPIVSYFRVQECSVIFMMCMFYNCQRNTFKADTLFSPGLWIFRNKWKLFVILWPKKNVQLSFFENVVRLNINYRNGSSPWDSLR